MEELRREDGNGWAFQRIDPVQGAERSKMGMAGGMSKGGD